MGKDRTGQDTVELSPAQMHTPHASWPQRAVLGHYKSSSNVHIPVDFMVFKHTWMTQYKEQRQLDSAVRSYLQLHVSM